MTRVPILFLSQCLPYPPTSGTTNRTFHILEQLVEEFEVHLLAFVRRNHQPTGEAIRIAVKGLEGAGVQVEGVFSIASERSMLGRLRTHLFSVASRKPYTYHDYFDPRFGEALRAVRARFSPRLAHLESLDLHRWLPDLAGVSVSCTHQNIESELLRMRAKHAGSAPVAGYLRHQAQLVEGVERASCPGFALNVVTSDLDGLRLAALAAGSATCTIPNGVDVNALRPPDGCVERPGEVLFLGPTYMFPNRDGVHFFLDQVWPQVRQEVPDASFVLVGKASPEDRRMIERHPGARCEGFVADIRPHLAAAACCIAPLRVGGGTRLKILDYWAMGKATVATTVGAEGLKTEDGVNILLRDEPRGIADAVIAILRDPELRRRLSRAARATAVETYSWDHIGRTLRERYHRLLGPSTG